MRTTGISIVIALIFIVQAGAQTNESASSNSNGVTLTPAIIIEAIGLQVVYDKITIVEQRMKPLVGSNYDADGKIYPYMWFVINNRINLQLWANKDAIIKINISKQFDNIVLDDASLNIINSNMMQALTQYSKINNIKADKLFNSGATIVVSNRTEAYYKVINNGEWYERYILKLINISNSSLYGEVLIKSKDDIGSDIQMPRIRFVGLGDKKRMLRDFSPKN